jgi:hypothetical protein
VDQRSIAFLEVMIAIGVIGVIAFLIFLISRYAMRVRAAAPDGAGAGAYSPQWYEYLLAAALVLVAAMLLLWQFPPGANIEWGKDARKVTFFVIMLVIGGAGLLIFLATVFWRIAQQRNAAAAEPAGPAPAAQAIPAEDATPLASHETPSVVRLLGLLLFGVSFLILCWAYVPRGDQLSVMLHFFYPAGMIVALVMLFDKASRAWNVKLPGETLREWLFCDALLFVYLLGYFNLLQSGVGDKYGGLFWDFIHIVGFLFVFWIVDRKLTGVRFLIAHAYFIALPILLLIWRSVQDVKIAADISWWSTIWPFFFLAVIFFVLEIIILIINRESQSQAVGTAKDLLFLVLYAILLIAAMPEAAA